jgi:hypothetical protein
MLSIAITRDSDPLWLAMLYSIAFMFGGLVLFGVDALRYGLLPRGNYLPFLAGIGFPAIAITSLSYEAVTGRGLEMSDLIVIVIFSVTGLALLALGRILRAEASVAPLAA